MKHIKLYEELYDDSPESIDRLSSLLGEFEIEDYEYEDGYLDVLSSVDLSRWDLTEFPITFRNIHGDFDCRYNKLTTLENGPRMCQTFDCTGNQLTSLEHAPDEVMDDFMCIKNQITSLKGCPEFVGWNLLIGFNPIHNFEGLGSFENRINFNGTPIANICGVDKFKADEFLDFKLRFEKAVDGKKVKLSLLKFLRLIYSSQVENLEELVIKNGYEIV